MWHNSGLCFFPLPVPRILLIILALYADDTTMYATAINPYFLFKNLHVHICLFIEWYNLWRIKINETKIATVYFFKTFSYLSLTLGPRVNVWCFSSYIIENEPVSKPESMDYLVQGRKTCPTTNRTHFQGYVVFKQHQRFTRCKKMVQGAHFEQAKGSTEETFTYCTRIIITRHLVYAQRLLTVLQRLLLLLRSQRMVNLVPFKMHILGCIYDINNFEIFL